LISAAGTGQAAFNTAPTAAAASQAWQKHMSQRGHHILLMCFRCQK
jgi:hypothetical protein